MTGPVVTVVLAAGRGLRMGGPKAMLAWPTSVDGIERPLAAAHAVTRLAAESMAVVIVVREALRRQLHPWLPEGSVAIASDEADELGAAGSIARAARWLASERPFVAEPSALLISPVDCPPVRASTAATLLSALEATPGTEAARPVHAGRRGHPVAVRWPVLHPYLRPSPPVLRDRLQQLGPSVRDVPVDDPLVRVDLDDPSRLAALGLGPPRFFVPMP